MIFQSIPAITGTAFDVTERKNAELRIRALASELSTTEQRSRRTLAAFLHDNIGHALAQCKMKVETLLESHDGHATDQSVQEMYVLIREAIQTTRSFTFQLSLPILFDLGLIPAIEWLVEETQKQYKIMVTLQKPFSKPPLSDEVRNVLFDGTKEVLMNAVKHGQSHCIDVTIHPDNSSLIIRVHDDGKGFDVSQLERLQVAHSSYGLFNVKERLKDVSGNIEIESQPQKGTTVTLIAPLHIRENISHG